MKKKLLNISKETLKTLSSKQLVQVGGGLPFSNISLQGETAFYTVDICDMLML